MESLSAWLLLILAYVMAIMVSATWANQKSIGVPAQERPSCINSINLGGHSNETGNAKDTVDILRRLRVLMHAEQLDAWLVSTQDEHASEYPADNDRRLAYLTGFTGSNGWALVLRDKAIVFTDSRYGLQAEQQLDCNWSLSATGSGGADDVANWLRHYQQQQQQQQQQSTANGANGATNGAGAPLRIGIDARLVTLHDYELIMTTVSTGNSLIAYSRNLIDDLWQRRPASGELRPLQVHDTRSAGNQTWRQKMQRVAESMRSIQAQHLIVTALDDIAWLLNLRGSDVPYSPVFKAYCLISIARNPASSLSSGSSTAGVNVHATVWLERNKLSQQVRQHLALDSSDGDNQHLEQIEVRDYEMFYVDLRAKLALIEPQARLVAPLSANAAVQVLVQAHEQRIIVTESLVGQLKAVKSNGEVANMRAAHARDSLAISMLLARLEHDLGTQNHARLPATISSRSDPIKLKVNNASEPEWDEVSAARQLSAYRALMDQNRGESFATISAMGPNGAIVHYEPHVKSAARLSNQSLYLLDSGGQYLDGTTDITRTVHFGTPNDEQRDAYTRVLLGSIDTMSLVFPGIVAGSSVTGSNGPWRSRLNKISDLVARRHLFEAGFDYGHGTGHGIGAYGLVHESPGIFIAHGSGHNGLGVADQLAPTTAAKLMVNPMPVHANQFTSVEPGHYRAHEFGIRIEDIVYTAPNGAQHNNNTANNNNDNQKPEIGWLKFECVSLVPYEPKLIKTEMLSATQKRWLNAYNQRVRVHLTHEINYYLRKLYQRRLAHNSLPQAQGIGSSLAEPNKHNESTSSSSSWLSRATRQVNNARVANWWNNLVDSRAQAPIMANEKHRDHTSPGTQAPVAGAHRTMAFDTVDSLNEQIYDYDQLRWQLELTHKWILDKTEPIGDAPPIWTPGSSLSRHISNNNNNDHNGQLTNRHEINGGMPMPTQQDDNTDDSATGLLLIEGHSRLGTQSIKSTSSSSSAAAFASHCVAPLVLVCHLLVSWALLTPQRFPSIA